MLNLRLFASGVYDLNLRHELLHLCNLRVDRLHSCADRVKDLDNHPAEPFLFWTASEDGRIGCSRRRSCLCSTPLSDQI